MDSRTSTFSDSRLIVSALIFGASAWLMGRTKRKNRRSKSIFLTKWTKSLSSLDDALESLSGEVSSRGKRALVPTLSYLKQFLVSLQVRVCAPVKSIEAIFSLPFSRMHFAGN